MTDGRTFPRVAGISALFGHLGRGCAKVLDTITAPEREYRLVMRQIAIENSIPYGTQPSAEQRRELRQIEDSLRALKRDDAPAADPDGNVS